MRQILLFFSLLLVSFMSYGQEIKGTVADELGNPLIGVTIHAMQSDKYTTTDFDGNFTLEAKEGEDIQFTFIGFQPLTMKASQNMKAVMIESTTELQDVVMIG